MSKSSSLSSKDSSLLTPACPVKQLQGSSQRGLTGDSSLSSGVSLIILTKDASGHLDNLLSSFFATNTHSPVELIIVDHACPVKPGSPQGCFTGGDASKTSSLLTPYSLQCLIRHIRRNKNYTFSESCNYGAARARHPYLLFLNDDIIYTSDVLPKAVEVLEDKKDVGAVGVRLDDVSEEEGVRSQETDKNDSKNANTSHLTPHSSLSQSVQHLGIEFKWNEKRGYHQPEQIRHPSLKDYLSGCDQQPEKISEDSRRFVDKTSSFFPAITGAAMLVRKSDFNALNGFDLAYNYGLEDIDFCLRLGRDHKKKCFCINDMGLQHVEGATRKDLYKAKSEIIKNNHKIFKERWDEYIKSNIIGKPSVKPDITAQPSPINSLPGETFTQCNTRSVLQSRITPGTQNEFPKGFHSGEQITACPVKHSPGVIHEVSCKAGLHQGLGTSSQRGLTGDNSASETPRILFILPDKLDSNNGYQVQLMSRMLASQGATCTIAVPNLSDEQRATNNETSSLIASACPVKQLGTSSQRGLTGGSLHVASYSSLLTPHSSLSFDLIHAWTPRENVRQFCEQLQEKCNARLIIHLEDNEEYLTEITVGRPWKELAKLPDKELDKLIPKNRYHPRKGKAFLEKADGLTMVIDTLNRFNTRNVPYQIIPPMVDERLFYPRPINRELRAKHNIPDDTTVLVYSGNVHAGNKDEVYELYKAVDLLNQQGRPTKLLRTGQDNPKLDTSSWPRKHEIHLGWVRREELPGIMAAADIFVQPGEPGPFNDERIPCKLPEYFAMGRPVVLPKTNLGLKVEHGVEGYVVDNADAEGIVHSVQEILKQQTMAGKLAAGGVGYYRSRLNDIILAVRLVTMYSAITDSKVFSKSIHASSLN